MRVCFSGPRIGGIRIGLSLGSEDLRSPDNATPRESYAFLYVIKDQRGRSRIGLSEHPNATLAKLIASSSLTVSLAWIGAPKDQAAAIERDAHAMLAPFKGRGHWYNISDDAAVGAIAAAAQRRGHPLLGLTPEQAEQIRLATLPRLQRPVQPWQVIVPIICGVVTAIIVAVLLSGS